MPQVPYRQPWQWTEGWPQPTQPFLNRAFTFGPSAGQRGPTMVLSRAPERACPYLGFILSRGLSDSMETLRQFIRDEDGQDVVEYGLLIATVAIVVLVGISFFGAQIQDWFKVLAGRITTTGVT